MRFVALAALAVLFLLVLGCASAPQNPPMANAANNSSSIGNEPKNTTQLANPASVNCVQKGYKLEIRKDASGGEVGYCLFANGRECEEWAFFRGQCNESGTVQKKAGEGEMCGGIAGIACADGLECQGGGAYPDASGTCTKVLKFKDCPANRGENCITTYAPVCGRSGATPSLYDYQDYSNSCVACSKSSPALIYADGTCSANNLTAKAKKTDVLYSCPEIRFASCTKEYDPVCGRIVDAGSSLSFFRDFGNPCMACAKDSNAIAYYVGTCASSRKQ